MADSEAAPTKWGKTVLIVVGVILLATLPFLPWLSRGLKQSWTHQAVVDAGGRASYSKRLVDSADYFTDKKDESKKWMRDLFGEAFAYPLTMVELQTEMPKPLVGRIASLPALESLDASGGNLNDGDVKNLSKATTLKKIWLNSNGGLTVAAFESLENLTGLMSLALDDTKLDDDGLDHIAKLSSLKRLYVANTAVTDAGIEKLVGLKQLLGIGLEGTKVGDGCLAHISQMAELEEIRLSDTVVSDAGISQLGQLAKLKSLTLTNTQLTSGGLTWLPSCANLEILDLGGTKVDDLVIDSIAQIPKLVSVSLRNTSVSDEAVNALKRRAGRGVTVQSDTGDSVMAN